MHEHYQVSRFASSSLHRAEHAQIRGLDARTRDSAWTRGRSGFASGRESEWPHQRVGTRRDDGSDRASALQDRGVLLLLLFVRRSCKANELLEHDGHPLGGERGANVLNRRLLAKATNELLATQVLDESPNQPTNQSMLMART